MMPTGIAGLDAVLGGGLLRGHTLMLQGMPGSGRTAVGLQIVAGAALLFGEPGVVLSLDPFPHHYLREAATLGWNLRTLAQQKRLGIVFAGRDDLYSSFAERESVALSRIAESAYNLSARRVLIDPGAEFFQLPLPGEERLKLLSEFLLKLKELDLTPVLTCNFTHNERAEETSIADCVLRLAHGPVVFPQGRRRRTVEVLKARGQGALEGLHSLRIDAGGVQIFPSPPPPPVELRSARNSVSDSSAVAPRCSTGLPDLDQLLGGGLPRPSITLLAGTTGTGKTLLAGHFIAAGLKTGESCALVTGISGAASLLPDLLSDRNSRDAAPPLLDRLTILQGELSSLEPLELFSRIEELVKSTGATRLVIDGLRQVLQTADAPREGRQLIAYLNNLCTGRGIAALYTCQTDPRATDLSALAEIPCTADMNNVICLDLERRNAELHRNMTILKASGCYTGPVVHTMVFTPAVVHIVSPPHPAPASCSSPSAPTITEDNA